MKFTYGAKNGNKKPEPVSFEPQGQPKGLRVWATVWLRPSNDDPNSTPAAETLVTMQV